MMSRGSYKLKARLLDITSWGYINSNFFFFSFSFYVYFFSLCLSLLRCSLLKPLTNGNCDRWMCFVQLSRHLISIAITVRSKSTIKLFDSRLQACINFVSKVFALDGFWASDCWTTRLYYIFVFLPRCPLLKLLSCWYCQHRRYYFKISRRLKKKSKQVIWIQYLSVRASEVEELEISWLRDESVVRSALAHAQSVLKRIDLYCDSHVFEKRFVWSA